MSNATHDIDKQPVWAWVAPAAACFLLALKFTGLVPAASPLVLILAALLLGGAVFAAVHHAEIIALRVGEPFGSIVLAIAVTVIEVALIVSIMVSAKEGGEELARDTVFATVMMVLNGIIGLCLVMGGARHHQQSFQTDASAAALSVLGTLAVITLVLPNYTLATPGPAYAPSQLILVGAVSLILYGVFLFVQTIRHRDYFLSEVESPRRCTCSHAGRAYGADQSCPLGAFARRRGFARQGTFALARRRRRRSRPAEILCWRRDRGGGAVARRTGGRRRGARQSVADELEFVARLGDGDDRPDVPRGQRGVARPRSGSDTWSCAN